MPNASDWVAILENVQSQYMPTSVQDTSVPFSVHTLTPSHPHDEHTLPFPYSLITKDNGVIFFVGGPIWALDWLPVPEPSANQILAVAPHRHMDDKYQIETAFSLKGTIQIWDIGAISMETQTPPTPQLCLTIAHEFGVVRAMKWCPSGCWESVGGAGDGVKSEGHLPRMGILAIASSDGCVRLLSIPHMVNEDGGCSSFPSFATPTSVAAVLVPYGLGTEQNSQKHTCMHQCLCLDWLPGNGHCKIAAGFSNGRVCIWNLECEFQIVPTAIPSPRIHPVMEIVAQKSPCTAVAWSPLDGNYLCTGGQDKEINVWDVRQPFSPVDTHYERSAFLVREIVWPLLWSGVFISQDNGGGSSSGVQYISYSHATPNNRPARFISDNYAPISSFSYCHWTDRVAAATFSGQLTITAVPTSFYRAPVPKMQLRRTQTVVMDTRLDYLSSSLTHSSPHTSGRETEGEREEGRREEVVCSSLSEAAASCRLTYVYNPSKQLGKFSVQCPPLGSINKICWNQNETTHELLALGTNSGLLHILRIPPLKEKPDLYVHKR